MEEGEHEAASKQSRILRRSERLLSPVDLLSTEEIIPLAQLLGIPNLASAIYIPTLIDLYSTPTPNPQSPFNPSLPNRQSKTYSYNLNRNYNESARTKRKKKMVWTADLHRKFLDAIDHLGLKNATPSAILKRMNVDGLTRASVFGHLYNYRLKEEKHGASSAGGVAGSSTLPATVFVHDAAEQQDRYQLMNIGQFLGNIDADYPDFFNIDAPMMVPPVKMAPPKMDNSAFLGGLFNNGASAPPMIDNSAFHGGLFNNGAPTMALPKIDDSAFHGLFTNEAPRMAPPEVDDGAFHSWFYSNGAPRMTPPKIDDSPFHGGLFNNGVSAMALPKIDDSAFHHGLFNNGAPRIASPMIDDRAFHGWLINDGAPRMTPPPIGGLFSNGAPRMALSTIDDSAFYGRLMALHKFDDSTFHGGLFNNGAPASSEMDNSAFCGCLFNNGAPIRMAPPIRMVPPTVEPVSYPDDLEEWSEEECEETKELPRSPKGKV